MSEASAARQQRLQAGSDSAAQVTMQNAVQALNNIQQTLSKLVTAVETLTAKIGS